MHAAPFAFVRRGGRFRDRSHRRPVSFMNELPSFFRWHPRPRRQSNDGTKLWRELGALLLKVSLEDTNAADFSCQTQQLIPATQKLQFTAFRPSSCSQ